MYFGYSQLERISFACCGGLVFTRRTAIGALPTFHPLTLRACLALQQPQLLPTSLPTGGDDSRQVHLLLLLGGRPASSTLYPPGPDGPLLQRLRVSSKRAAQSDC